MGNIDKEMKKNELYKRKSVIEIQMEVRGGLSWELKDWNLVVKNKDEIKEGGSV